MFGKLHHHSTMGEEEVMVGSRECVRIAKDEGWRLHNLKTLAAFHCATCCVGPTSHAAKRCPKNRRSIGLRARASAARKCSPAISCRPLRSSSSPRVAK